MEPIEAVNQEAFAAYVRQYADADPTNIPYILRYWNEAKSDWFHSFGNKLVLEKRIHFQENPDKTQSRMFNLRYENKDYNKIHNALELALCSICHVNTYRYILSLMDSYTLVTNSYHGPTVTIPFEKPIKVQYGCRPIPTLHKILRAIGYPEDSFERFRIAHSQILNTSTTYGTLCLSIDPLDYITMSDNDCGWNSCMCWADYNGEYHGGTIEMMNSPYVLMAYIKSDDPYYPCDCQYPFSNKKWRQLIIAVPNQIIVGNRHYPFNCEDAEKEALSWVRQLIKTDIPFHSELVPFENKSSDNPYAIQVSIDMEIMYNDVYEERMAYFVDDDSIQHIYVNASGPRNCMSCGELIGVDEPAEWTTCANCNNYVICAQCGCYVTEGEYWSNDDGEFFCQDCVNTPYISICNCCNQPYSNDNIIDFNVNFNNDIHHYAVCHNCYPTFGDFGELDNWNAYHYDSMSEDVQKFVDDLEY